MASHSVNRFALIAEDDEKQSPTNPGTHSFAVPLPVSGYSDNPWQEVRQKHKAHKVLVIQNEQRPPPNAPSNHLENWCGICGLQFNSKTLLWTHIKQSPGHENVCNLCKRVFKDRNGLQNHRDNALGHDHFCNLCLSAFKDNWGLRNHFENNLSATHGHESACLVCLLGFNSKDSLQFHLRTDAKHVWCKPCNRKFKCQDERDKHWRRTKNHRHCLEPGCEYDCTNQEQLDEHLRDDHFQCEGCLSVFPSQNRLNGHMEICMRDWVPARDPGPRPLPALRGGEDECAEKTSSEVDAQEIQPRTRKCWLCDTTFFTMTHLIKHIETGKCVHLPDASYLHLVISKMWYTPLYMDPDIHRQIRKNLVTLKDFVEFVKSGFMPYRCHEMNACGRTFGDLRSLVHHVESGECKWTLETLKLDDVEKQFMNCWDGGKVI